MISDGPAQQRVSTEQTTIPVPRIDARPGAVPVLAFGSGLTALGVLRCLHGAGIETYTVTPPGDLATKSRYHRPAPLWRGAVPETDQLREYLEQVPFERAVLFPCSDDWARAISELPESTLRRFPACISEASVIRTMTDKWRFFTFLECVNVPRPRTLRVDSLHDLEKLPESCFGEMFLKPIDSQEFSRRNRAKAFAISGKQDAVAVMRRAQNQGMCAFPILLQEFIPGPPTRAYILDGFLDRNGSLRALVARHRISQYPPRFGNTARSETVPLSEVPGAIQTLEAMWATVNYRGIFSAEFKLDERDGLLKIIEVNARPWWFVEFTHRCGVDVCSMSYRDALGLPVDRVTGYAVGRCCVHASYDLASQLENRGGLRGLFRWMRSLFGTEDIIYRWNDPWPGVHAFFSALKTYRRRRHTA